MDSALVGLKMDHVSQLLISEVARNLGVRPSTIRYYEHIGILPPAVRVSGQRRYDRSVLYRLAVIKRAQELGFTLEQVRELFFGFRSGIPASARWKKLARQKLVELDALTSHVKTMRRLLKKLMDNCQCSALEDCGRGILRSRCGEPITKMKSRISGVR
jgi:MerR family transcriptional regulator, redox-sensitive transcriptional activator SoxR